MKHNTPTHPGAMTPAQLAKRTLYRIAHAAAMVATSTAAVAVFTIILILFN